MADLFGGGLPVPIEVQIAEVSREIEMRKRVYDKRIAEGKMTRRNADRQIGVMQAVFQTLDGVRLAYLAPRPTRECAPAAMTAMERAQMAVSHPEGAL